MYDFHGETIMTINRTREEVFKLWVDALRSGEYKKSTGALRTRHGDRVGYCCFGVLCDLARLDGGDDWGPYGGYQGQSFRAPKAMLDFLRISLFGEDNLIDMNDYQVVPFRNIADYIEKAYL
jgi:hypothetical protein